MQVEKCKLCNNTPKVEIIPDIRSADAISRVMFPSLGNRVKTSCACSSFYSCENNIVDAINKSMKEWFDYQNQLTEDKIRLIKLEQKVEKLTPKAISYGCDCDCDNGAALCIFGWVAILAFISSTILWFVK